MPRTISMDEARSNLESVFQWAKENKDDVIIEKSGKPEGVLVPYDEYTEIVRLRKQELKRKAWAEINEIRKDVAERNQDLTAEEIFRLAGFDEEVIQEMIEYDRRLAHHA